MSLAGANWPTVVAPHYCLWHDGLVEPGGGVVVGWIDTGSGPGRDIVACQACVIYYGIMRFRDHPDDTDGLPRYVRSGG
jgi:hypothetical protein